MEFLLSYERKIPIIYFKFVVILINTYFPKLYNQKMFVLT
jgi:hypothetical protein